MNRTIASLSVGTALTLAVASGFFFTSSFPSVGQSNTDAVTPELTQQVDTLKRGGESETTSDDPITDFLADENWITIPAGKYEVGCGSYNPNDKRAPRCEVMNIPEFQIHRFEVTIDLWEQCVSAGTCNPESPSLDHMPKSTPISLVTIQDVGKFIKWLNGRGEDSFRIPSVTEYHVAAGNMGESSRIISFDDCVVDNWGGGLCNTSTPTPVGYGYSNQIGLYNIYGNIQEYATDEGDTYYYVGQNFMSHITPNYMEIFRYRDTPSRFIGIRLIRDQEQ